MRTVIKCVKENKKIKFKELKDREYFYSNGILYLKILQQDLGEYRINNINAVSLLNAGLTFFQNDEIVYRSTKEYSMERKELFQKFKIKSEKVLTNTK